MHLNSLRYALHQLLDRMWREGLSFYLHQSPVRRGLIASSLVFAFLFAALGLLIAILLERKRRLERREARIRSLVYRVLEKALFESLDAGEDSLPVSRSLERLAARRHLRPLFSRQLCQARKDLKGEAGLNLQRLYEQFGLQQDALKRLRSRHWHRRAAAVKELYLMDQRQCGSLIEPLTRHPNEYLRMEAQTCMLHFLGPEGLRFLEGLKLPVSEWQQIQLLGQLQEMHPETIPGLEGFLGSPNPSIRCFALKLTGSFQQHSLLTRAGLLLRDPVPAVQREALRCLSHFYDEEVVQLLLESYKDLPQDGRRQALELMGRQDHPQLESFLMQRLRDLEPELQLEAGRALLRHRPEGFQLLAEGLGSCEGREAMLEQWRFEAEEGRL